jgi:hypothetical protein
LPSPFFFVSPFRLSIYACLSTNTTCMQTNRSVKERKLTYLWSLWAYGTSDFCHYYDYDQTRSVTQQQGQIDEGAERRRASHSPPAPPTTRSPRTPTLPKSKSRASTRDSGAILKCQCFFFRSHFRCLLGYTLLFFGLQVSFEMPTFLTWLVPLFLLYRKFCIL